MNINPLVLFRAIFVSDEVKKLKIILDYPTQESN